MKTPILLPLLSAGACLVLASCETVNEQQTIRQRTTGGYPDGGPSRYVAPTQSASGTTVETTDPSSASMPSESTGSVSSIPSESVTTPSVEPSTPPVPPPPTSSATTSPGSVGSAPAAPQGAPTYGKMVPGRPGFVYPPGVDAKPENMVDVRDFTPGQKVRDPRTGKIFLVP